MLKSRTLFLSGGDEDFTRLLTPLSESKFFSSYWESKPFISSQRDSDFYAELFPLSSFENILRTIPLRVEDIRVVKSGESIAENRYMRQGFASAKLLIKEYEAGSTLVVNGA